ncbi:MAG: efflux RND transporter periplasmic adaptor subunit [Bacteroidia bacterium]
MNRHLVHISIAAMTILLVACGRNQPLGLEGKKRLLQTKKQQLLILSNEVSALEAEIAQLDPEARAKARQAVVGYTEVASSTFRHFVKVQGQVEANQNILVSPEMGGRITQIRVQEGQTVGAGTVLLQLDDAVMARSIEEVQTQLDLANTVFEKQARLWEQKIGTEIQYLTAKNQKESLERRLATLREQLEMSKIKAPISGTIDEIMAKTGEMAAPGMPVLRIVSARDLSLKAALSEAYIPFVHKGDRVQISFPALGREIEARVHTVGQSIHVRDRTFEVTIQLPNDSDFKPNMFGEVAINDRTVEQAVTIPSELVQQSDLGAFVYTAVADSSGTWKARRVDIALGLSYAGEVVVEKGLKAGDRLINAGYKDLSDGQEVIFNEPLANE